MATQELRIIRRIGDIIARTREHCLRSLSDAKLQPAEDTVHALYARWAELEAKQQ